MSSPLSGFRGAVAFSLALKDTSTEVRRTIFTTTLLLVAFTIWVLGTAADPMLRRLNIRLVLQHSQNDASQTCRPLSPSVRLSSIICGLSNTHADKHRLIRLSH